MAEETKQVVLLKTDTPNAEGVLIPRSEMELVLSPGTSFMTRVSLGALRGEVGPFKDIETREVDIDESKVCHSIEKVWMSEDGIVHADVKAAGPKKDVFTNTPEPKFGLRAFANFEKVGENFVPKPGSLDIVTFDLINPKIN